jgi:hypothetical protein
MPVRLGTGGPRYRSIPSGVVASTNSFIAALNRSQRQRRFHRSREQRQGLSLGDDVHSVQEIVPLGWLGPLVRRHGRVVKNRLRQNLRQCDRIYRGTGCRTRGDIHM